MAKITLSDAATLTGKSRNTLYRAIKAGKLSRDPDDTIDTAELLRAGFALRQPDPPADAVERAAAHHGTDAVEHAAATGTPPVSHVLEQAVAAVEHERALWERERDLLRHELAAAHEREAAARAREAQRRPVRARRSGGRAGGGGANRASVAESSPCSSLLPGVLAAAR